MTELKRMTGYPHSGPRYVVDHIIPLARGGADRPSNMQWLTIQGKRYTKRLWRAQWKCPTRVWMTFLDSAGDGGGKSRCGRADPRSARALGATASGVRNQWHFTQAVCSTGRRQSAYVAARQVWKEIRRHCTRTGS